MIGEKYNLSLTVGDIGGSVFSGLQLKELFIQYNAGDTLYQLGYIENLKLQYSLTDLWKKQWVIKQAEIYSIDLKLYEQVIENFKTRETDKKERGAPDFRVENIMIHSASFNNMNKETPVVIEDLNLFMGFANSADSMILNIDSLGLAIISHGFAVERLHGVFMLMDSSLTADSVTLHTLGSDVNFSTRVDDLKTLVFDMDMHPSKFDLAQIGNVFDLELIGDLNVEGQLRGNPSWIFADLSVDGSIFEKNLRQITSKVEYSDGQLAFYDLLGGAFNSRLRGDGMLDFKALPNSYLFAGQMENFNLNSLVENTFETSFSGEVIVDGEGFSTDDFMINLKAELGQGYFDIYKFDSVYGFADVFLDSIIFSEPLQVTDRGAMIEAAGKIEYLNDINMFGSGVLTDVTPLVELIQLDNITGRGSGTFSFQGPLINPRLQAEFFSDSLEAYDLISDSVHILVDLEQFALNLQGGMSFRSDLFHYGKYDGDSIWAELRFDSNMILIDTIDIDSKRLSSVLNMNLEFLDSVVNVDVPQISIAMDTFTIYNNDTIIFSVSNDGWVVDELKLISGSGSLEVQGELNINDGIEFEIINQSLDLNPILGFYVPDQKLQGIADFKANVSGTYSNPILLIDGRVDSVSLQDQYFGDLIFSADYRDSSISIDSVVLGGTGNETFIIGEIPLNLAFEKLNNRLIQDKSIDLTVRSQGTGLYLLPVIVPDIEWIEGANYTNITISGTPDDPQFSGSFLMKDGQVKSYYLENILNNVNADIKFEGRDIILTNVTATNKNRNSVGEAILTGVISMETLLKPRLDLDISAENYPFKYDIGEIEGVIKTANLNLAGSDTILATGEVELSSFKYAESFEPIIETEAMQAINSDNNFNYNVIITAPSNLKVDNQEFNVELSGELRVFKQGNFQNFLGELETIRGKYFFIDQSFTVLPGGQIIFDEVEEFNPRLNVEVETNMTSQGERLKARLLLSGTLNEPKLTATEDSEVGENQFFEYISFQRVYAGGENNSSPFADRLTIGASEIAMNRVSQYFARRIGIETFEINPYYDGNELDFESAELRIGMYTSSNLYIYGATQLDFKRAREVGFEYRLSRRLFLSGQRDEKELYHLNLNLNWEF